MPRKSKKFRITRSNIPLLLAVLFIVAALAVLVFDGSDDAPVMPPPEQVADEIAEPEPIPVEQQASDAIGDLIASLEPEPQVPHDRAPAWRQYAVPAPPDDGRPMIAIVIDDVGLSHESASAAIALQAPVTLAFLPYANGLSSLAASARGAGHEAMVHMPMEPGDSSVDPGPHALRVGLGEEELRKRIAWNLDRFVGYVGFNNHMGSRFTADATGMRVVIDEAKRRGLIFLDSRTTKETKGRTLAEAVGVPVVERQVFLDNTISSEAVAVQLARAEKIAREKGAAVAIGHPHAVTLAAVQAWLKENNEFAVVPISTMVIRGVGTGNGGYDPAYSDRSGY